MDKETDAVHILHKRYIDNDPRRKRSLSIERLKEEVKYAVRLYFAPLKVWWTYILIAILCFIYLQFHP